MTGSRCWHLFKVLLLCICLALPVPVRAADSVLIENLRLGTSSWQLTNPASMWGVNSLNPSDYAVAEIQGYASRTSVNQGGSITFYVRTINTNPYTLSIYRIGWYAGLGGRLMQAPVTLSGVVQPMPPAPVYQPAGTGLVECNWTPSYSLNIPADWVSGVYLVKLSLSVPAKESYILFVVRDDARNSPFLHQLSVATYQAYNEWGGSSLYTWNAGTKTGYKVSFNRPYWRNFGAGDFVNLNGSPGVELNMVRWLERQGYDVTYATDIDLHENPNLLLSHKALLVVGHGEYWSWSMRANVERARDSGVHIGFFAANTCYWQVRFEPSSDGSSNRTMIGYKEIASLDHPADSRYVTTLWRDTRPEEALLGIQYNGVSDVTPSDIVVTNASHWLFTLSGVSNGSVLPNVLGYETDSIFYYGPIGTSGLAHSPFPKNAPQVYSDMSIYTAPSGANIFATGSIDWSTGLDSYPPSNGVVPAVQQVTANFLSQALQGSPPVNGRLPATVATSSEVIAFPASNAGDGNYYTQWIASLNGNDPNNNNAWIRLDLGARRWVRSVKWLGASGTPYPAMSPTNYSIQISDDGMNWQTIVARTNASPVVNGSEPLNEQARFVRLATTLVGDGTGWALSFFEFWAEGTTSVPSGRLKTFATQANAEAPNYPAIYATDLDPSTQWVASLDATNPNNNNAWIRWDLGSRKQIDKVRWSGATGTPYPAFSPTNYSIQVSDDAASWRTILTRSNASAVVSGNETMSAQGRYVMLTSTRVGDGTGWSLSFFEIWAEGSDASNVLGGNVAASSQDPSYPASNATDGNNSTLWLASTHLDRANNNAWIQLDFGCRKQINRVRWLGANQVPYPAESPTNYSIQVSNDLINWTTVVTKTNASHVIVGDELVNVQSRYLRLATTQVGDGSGWALGLFEFWAEGY